MLLKYLYLFLWCIAVLFSACDAPIHKNPIRTDSQSVIVQPKDQKFQESPELTEKNTNSIDSSQQSGDDRRTQLIAASKPTKSLTATKFNFNQFDESFILTYKLKEVSGLGFNNLDNKLYAINDEYAIIYQLDVKTSNITSEFKFGKPGDFEGIEVVGNTIYVIQSNGKLYSYNIDSEKKSEYKTALKSVNDVEGLGYSKTENALLIACKGNAALKNHSKSKSEKSIYKFDLDTKSMDKQPYITITDKSLNKYYRSVWMRNKRLTLKATKAYSDRLESFSPSGITVDDLTGDFYIISSVGKLLIQLNANKAIKGLYFLDGKMHKQPEGISFDNNNSLYISNEGKGLSSKIFRYDPK